MCHLVYGTIILFDEYWGYKDWEKVGEALAWDEVWRRYQIPWEPVGTVSQKLSVRVTGRAVTC